MILTPWFLGWIGFIVLALVVRRWWQIRKHQKAREEQIAALAPVARDLGGTVTGPEGATAWSADLCGPLSSEVDGVWNKLFQRSTPQFDVALDFPRGPWHVRVTEASVRKAVVNGTGVRWEQEHRIEVATVRLPPTKFLRPLRFGMSGRPQSSAFLQEQRFQGWVAQSPVTAEREQREWQPVMLLPPMDEEFWANSTDPVAAERLLDPEALKWLSNQQPKLPLAGQHMRLTFEAGFVYAVFSGPVDLGHVVNLTDTIVGLLERMPGARPRHPAATA
ncbi:hypothetical protein ACSHWB_15920 [Lentzea sp. HUAS TT2]|uniref:hypothetical protein n=1 Tax=Lentzea sp. HUAS TT2 TaxID=3447454 RepID=UPI003F703551